MSSEMKTSTIARRYKISDEFLQRIIDFSGLAHRNRIQIKPFSESGIQKFSEYSSADQEKIAFGFSKYADLMMSAEQEGVNLRVERETLKFVLPRLGLSASDEAINAVSDDDVIEIYNADNIQIYRNLKFMEYCNYSILDLVAYPFFDLYERSSIITERLLTVATEIFTTDVEGLDLADRIPVHLIKERFSEKQETFVVSIKHVFPLFSGPQARSGILVLQSGNPVDESRKANSEGVAFL